MLKTSAEKWAHICKQRNELESDLRKMVKAIIKVAHKNESEAKTYVIKKIYGNDPKYARKTYQELFDSRSSNIYLKSLTDLINADWAYFSDYFGKQDVFIANMTLLNNEGRFDAHATVPDDDEINTIDSVGRGYTATPYDSADDYTNSRLIQKKLSLPRGFGYCSSV